MFVWHFTSYLLSLLNTIVWKCHEYLVKIPWKLQNKFHGCIHGHEFSMKIEPFHLMTHVFSMKTWHETFHGPWKHGQDFHEPWNCHEKLSLLISWAMKTWHETFKGHEFAINLIKEYFRGSWKTCDCTSIGFENGWGSSAYKEIKTLCQRMQVYGS